jgi:putative nucleotidyltransferase with HDIG domain
MGLNHGSIWKNHSTWSGWRNKGFQLLSYLGLGIMLFVYLMGHITPKSYIDLKVGSRSPEKIVSPITIVDEVATNRAKEKAASQVQPVYTRDDSKTEDQLEYLDYIFKQIKEINANPQLKQSERIAAIKESMKAFRLSHNLPEISEDSYKTMANLPPESIATIQYITKYLVEEIMKQGVEDTNEGLTVARDRVNELLVEVESSSAVRKVTQELARHSIRPNVFYDPQKTEEKKNEARKAVEDIYIYENDVILQPNETITSEHLRQLELVGLMQTSMMKPYIGLCLLILIMLGMIWFYTYQSQSSVISNNLHLLMYFVIIALNVGVMKIISLGQSLGFEGIGYAAPIAFGPLLIAMLLNTRLAYFSSILFALIAGILFNENARTIFDVHYMFVGLIGTVVGAYVVGDAQSRSKILRSGFFIALANMAVIITLQLLGNVELHWDRILQLALYTIVSGLLSGVFTLGFMPFFEAAFGILSAVKLIELSNPNQPLLRKLLIETPGTYHHSVMVANLSEAAAEAIGANGLLARVGAYYHDLGKTKRPSFFIENQMGIDNPHDHISPQLSKTIITAHPYDGVKMLKEYKFPKAIIDIAEQHHGTSLLKYFYHKALKENDQVKEEDFRYPGPKPQFKEAAIVFICDSVEAAVRSMQKPTPEQIEVVVKKIIKDKLDDGQLDDCDLTLKELDLINQAILETLHGTFHSRIEYPADSDMEVKHA